MKTFWWVPNIPTAVFAGQTTDRRVSVGQIKLENDTIQSVLTIKSFQADFQGQYLCGAENSAGFQNSLGQIMVTTNLTGT